MLAGRVRRSLVQPGQIGIISIWPVATAEDDEIPRAVVDVGKRLALVEPGFDRELAVVGVDLDDRSIWCGDARDMRYGRYGSRVFDSSWYHFRPSVMRSSNTISSR